MKLDAVAAAIVGGAAAAAACFRRCTSYMLDDEVAAKIGERMVLLSSHVAIMWILRLWLLLFPLMSSSYVA